MKLHKLNPGSVDPFDQQIHFVATCPAKLNAYANQIRIVKEALFIIVQRQSSLF